VAPKKYTKAPKKTTKAPKKTAKVRIAKHNQTHRFGSCCAGSRQLHQSNKWHFVQWLSNLMAVQRGKGDVCVCYRLYFRIKQPTVNILVMIRRR
jgi:hypothetical protein